ncbi:MAG: hypothetical protein IT319_11490 [Anaerolineae bacterium]|nr:hypothetical protein [Anaerolineae bacterium]
MTRFRKLAVIISVLALVLIVGVIILLSALADFSLPLQDCNGARVHLFGTVRGSDQAVVWVKGDSKLHGGSGAIDLHFLTDSSGSFDSGTTYLPVFICESLQITVSAPGFISQSLDYMPLYHFSEDELAASITSGQPLSAHLEIELQTAE